MTRNDAEKSRRTRRLEDIVRLRLCMPALLVKFALLLIRLFSLVSAFFKWRPVSIDSLRSVSDAALVLKY